VVPRRGLAFLALVAALCLGGKGAAGELPEDWNSHESVYVTVHVPQRADRTGSALSEKADDVVVELMELTGKTDARGRIHAYIAPTRDSFTSIQPREPPSWAAGTAYPDRNLVFVTLATHGGKTPYQVFVHELAHVVLHWSYGEAEPPRWLEEGLAQVAAREFNLETQAILSRAALGGGLMSFRSLDRRWPDDPARARVAYAESRDFVLFVRQRHGDDALAYLVRELASGTEIEQAVLNSTGFTLDELERQWSSRLRRRYAWLPVIGGSGTFWGLAAFLLVIGWARKRRQRRRKLAEMAAKEAALDERRMGAWEPESDRTPLWKDPPGSPTVR